MKLTTDRILDDLLDISERLAGPAPRFLRLLDQALEAKLEGDGEKLAVAMFRLGLVLGTDEHRKLTLTNAKRTARAPRGRAKQAKKYRADLESKVRNILRDFQPRNGTEKERRGFVVRQLKDRHGIILSTKQTGRYIDSVKKPGT